MSGPHSAERCYLRGPAFCTTELEQRINLFSIQHGSKSPANQDPPKWNPHSLNPTHKHASTSKQSSHNKNYSRPFENYDQKSTSKSVRPSGPRTE